MAHRIHERSSMAQRRARAIGRSHRAWWVIIVIVAVLAMFTAPVGAQTLSAPSTGATGDSLPFEQLNPLRVLEDAGEATPGLEGGLSSTINIILLLTVLSLAPSVLIMCTCFTRIIIVIGLLRQALGTQGLPPSQVIVGLSMFLTIVVMAPTAEQMYVEGIRPYITGENLNPDTAWAQTKQPLRDFMFAQLEQTGNWSGLYMILEYRGVDTSDPATITRADVDLISLIPAFILSELKVAFLIGFQIYLPFLVIDMVIASLLISMGMLMLPPVLISLPFKLLLFVLVDGWQLIVGSMMNSVSQAHLVAAVDSTAQLFAIGVT